MGLNARQVEILQWIADGTPERDWPDWTHRATAKALQSRGLAKVRGHGSAWTATITERGQRVLAGNETVPTRGARTRVRTGRKTRQPGRAEVSAPPVAVSVDPEDLISVLMSAPDHTIRIPAPDLATRAGYRRALATIPTDRMPTGKRVMHTGRHRGDLVIRLADLPDPATPDPSVTVLSSPDPGDPLIAWLIRNPGHLDVAENSRDRALRIVQGVAAALTGRGHAVSRPRAPAESHPPRPDTGDGWSANTPEPSSPQADAATFEVTIGDQTLTIDLHEEQQKVSTVPPEEAANLKYDWQRATPVERWEFNGRLALRLRGRASNPVWADRKRWALESCLPRVVRTIEEAAQDLAQAKQRAEEAKRQRRQQWEQALPKARAAYLADMNRDRLDKQLNLFLRAEQLRRYADAVSRRAADLAQEERAAAETWAAWIHNEADRHDPTLNNANLIYSEPPEIGPWDLDKYMPPGFQASGPPD